MFKKMMRKLGVSALVAILPVILMGGVVYGADPEDLPSEDAPRSAPAASVEPVKSPTPAPAGSNSDGFPSHVSSEFENVMNESSAKENDPRVGEAQKAFDQAAKDRVEAEQNYDNAVSEVEKAKAALDAESAERQASQNLKSAEQRAIDEFNNQKQSVLPSTTRTIAECKVIMNKVQMDSRAAKEKFEKRDDVYVKEVLGCGIKTGDISLWMVPYYIRFILEFILQLGGLIAVGGIIYGGYLYLFAGLSDDKDRGKKAIIYGVGGIVLAMTAWALVNIVISVVTA